MASGGLEDELSLGDYVAILRRRWVLALLILTLTVGAAAAISLQTDQRYRSEATVLVFTNFSQSLFPAPPGNATELFRSTANELEFARSSALTDQLTIAIGDDLEVDVDDEGSDTLRFQARSAEPQRAEALALAAADAYVDSREQQVEANLLGSLAALESSITELESQRDELLEPIAPLDDALARETDADTISRLTTQRLTLLQSLDDDLGPVRGQLSILNNERAQLAVLVDYVQLNDDAGARVLGAPTSAESVTASLERNLALAIVLGAILAMGAALLAENLFDRIRSEADIEHALPGVPVLATLPDVGNRLEAPITWAAIGELGSYRAGLERLVTGLRFVAQGEPLGSLAVVAAREDVGKTTVAASLSLAVANSGDTVLLVDGDHHRSSLPGLFGLALARGLSDVAAGDATIEEAAVLMPSSDCLAVMGPGSARIDPGELWRSATTGPLMGKLCAASSLTIFDTPPLLAVADAVVIGEAVDGCVLLARAKQTTAADLRTAVQRLQFAGARIAGVVLVGGEIDSYYESQT